MQGGYRDDVARIRLRVQAGRPFVAADGGADAGPIPLLHGIQPRGAAAVSEVRQAFDDQAGWCARLGSPFTAFVCRTLAESLTDATAVGRAVLGWQGDPGPSADSVPLRVCGALHALARSGPHPKLSELYRTFSQDAQELHRVLDHALVDSEPLFLDYLAVPPQTNEVGRSAAVMAGLLCIDAECEKPIALYELGASAGLNLIPDLYAYEFAGARRGGASALVLKPEWIGPIPPDGESLEVISRKGVDIAPISLESKANRDRLISYVWPDQTERLARVQTAMDRVRKEGVRVDQGDAGAWLEEHLRVESADVVRVVFHTIAWSYFSEATKTAVTSAMERAASRATQANPLAWLRYELEPSMPAALRLSTWPQGSDRLLAKGHPHGTVLEWLGGM